MLAFLLPVFLTLNWYFKEKINAVKRGSDLSVYDSKALNFKARHLPAVFVVVVVVVVTVEVWLPRLKFDSW